LSDKSATFRDHALAFPGFDLTWILPFERSHSWDIDPCFGDN
jgi:hypothetical protein